MQDIAEKTAAADLADYLGPAHVVGVDGRDLDLEMPDGSHARAVIAFVFPYEPRVGDVLLAIGRAKKIYAIGVLHGTGATKLGFAGDVEIASTGGSVRIAAERGVEVAAPEVSLTSKKLRFTAVELLSKVGSLYQRVTELLSVHAKETHTVVDETAFAKAKAATVFTEETMTLNGKQIHLG